MCPAFDPRELALWEGHGFQPTRIRLELQTARKKGVRKSCGAIIYRTRWRTPQYLLVRHVNGGHWGYPKGHVNAGETEMETAAREIREEVGLHVSFRNGFYETIAYLTAKERRKEVVYFLSRVHRPRVRIDPGEIAAYQWNPYWKTRETLTFENDRLLLDRARDFLEQRGT